MFDAICKNTTIVITAQLRLYFIAQQRFSIVKREEPLLLPYAIRQFGNNSSSS